MSASEVGDPTYASRIETEVARYRDDENVHDLPAIYHYWSGRHVDPLLAELGYESLQTFFVDPILERGRALDGKPVRVVSLGSGNGDLELALAERLRSDGLHEFSITRLELNDSMRARAQRDAQAAGLASHFLDQEADLNSWVPSVEYDVAIANHSLHHVSELEHLFEQVRTSLLPDGCFVINDMIGRNGHMRWPEALVLLESIWAVMPDRYKYNRQLHRHEATYENMDHSLVGFEGIRAQDILPLLNSEFYFEKFIAYANVIDVFVDRGFGPNFDVESQQDRDFIDAVAQLDESALALGVVKPTHLFAHYRVSEVSKPLYAGPLSPELSVRSVEVPRHDSDETSRHETDSDLGAALSDGAGKPDGMVGVAKALAATVPPIRRLRAQRDSLAAEVEALRAQLAQRKP